MDNFQICVPSFGREDWKGLEFLDQAGIARNRIWLFLHNREEWYGYKSRKGGLKGINVIVTEVKEGKEGGVRGQKQYIMDKMMGLGWDRYVMLDDDIRGWYKLEIKVNRQGRILKRWQGISFQKSVEECFDKADRIGLGRRVWSFGAFGNPHFASKEMEIGDGKCGGSGIIGISKGWRTKIQGRLWVDVEIMLRAAVENQLVRFNWVHGMFDHNVKEGGGCYELHKGLRNDHLWRRMVRGYSREDIRKFGRIELIRAMKEQWKGGVCRQCSWKFPTKRTMLEHQDITGHSGRQELRHSG